MARAPRVVVVLLALGLCGLARPASATPCGATFTDDPLLVNTVAKAVHVTELRTAINCVRAEVSLGAASWTQTITAGTTTIAAVDVTEMRTALNAAYSAASLTAPSYTDTSLTGVLIKAIHLQELRTAVRILATPDASSATWTLNYYHTDVIGSVRAITDSSGNTVIRHDYAAFGEDSQPLTGDPLRFAGKELDAESGWNYFDARYFRNIYGRFGTVDPVDGTLTDTQSWNKYAYARNSPFVYTDPTGMTYTVCGDVSDSGCFDMDDADFEAEFGSGCSGRFCAAGGTMGGIFTRSGQSVGRFSWWCFCNKSSSNDDSDGSSYVYDTGPRSPTTGVVTTSTVFTGIVVDTSCGLLCGLVSDIADRTAPVQTVVKGAVLAGSAVASPWLLAVQCLFVDCGTAGTVLAMVPSPGSGLRFTADQAALIALSKEAKATGGVTLTEGNILLRWAQELGIAARGPEQHLGRNFKDPHIHIGPVDHLPVKK